MRYPPLSDRGCFGARNLATHGGASLPAEPTGAIPGSPDKIAVLTQRAAAGVALHHPGDACPDGSEDLPGVEELLRRMHRKGNHDSAREARRVAVRAVLDALAESDLLYVELIARLAHQVSPGVIRLTLQQLCKQGRISRADVRYKCAAVPGVA